MRAIFQPARCRVLQRITNCYEGQKFLLILFFSMLMSFGHGCLLVCFLRIDSPSLFFFFICKVVYMAIQRVFVVDLFFIDRTLRNNNEVDYGDAICFSSLEARISVYRNLHHGHQPTDSKILQPCGKLNFFFSPQINDTFVFFFICSLMMCLYVTKSQAFQKFSRIDT